MFWWINNRNCIEKRHKQYIWNYIKIVFVHINFNKTYFVKRERERSEFDLNYKNASVMRLCATEQIKHVRVLKNKHTIMYCIVISRSHNSKSATPGHRTRRRCVYEYVVRLPSSTSDSIRATHQIIIMCNHEISTFQVPFWANKASTWQTVIWDTPTPAAYTIRIRRVLRPIE